MKEYAFPKTEHLKSNRLFRKVIFEGHAVFQHPLRLLFNVLPKDAQSTVPVLAGFSISKRKHPKATTRNLMKRRMREAFRRNKGSVYQSIQAIGDHQLHLVVIYQVGAICDYHQIEIALVKGLKKLETLIQSINMKAE